MTEISPIRPTCPICGRPVPINRRKFCSAECADAANRAAAAIRSAKYYRQTFARRRSERAPRVCLSCGETFASAGPWNRICPDCRGRHSEFAPIRVVRWPTMRQVAPDPADV